MAQALVVDVAGEFCGEIEIVADDVFEMDAGDVCIGEERHQGWFAFVVLVLRDATVVHRLFKTEPREHLALRKSQALAYLEQLVSQSSRAWSRISHQELPPDVSANRRENFRLRGLPDGSSMRSLTISAAKMIFTFSPAMLITRRCGSWSCA